MSNIIRLEAENVKRLEAVEIKPNGEPLVVVGGRNGAGKTTVLDAIEMALAGGKSIPKRPIRDGKSSARVVVETDDLIVTRTFSQKGSRLLVEGKNGAKFPSPQHMLDELVGGLSFDPLAFARQDAKAQAETLRELTGLDLSAVDAEIKSQFDNRTLANRTVASLKAQLQAAPKHDDAPDEEVSMADLIRQSGEARRIADTNRETKEDFEAAWQLVRDAEHEADSAKAAVEEAQRRLAAANDAIRRRSGEAEELRQKVNGLRDPGLEAIEAKMADAEGINAKVRDNAAHSALKQRLLEAAEEVGKLDAIVDSLREQRADTIASAVMPIDGLELGDDGVTFKGIPFDQCSSAEQLRVSLAMGLAMSKDLKVMLIRDGSLLDAESLEIVREMATSAGAQVWLERVGDGPCSVLIEDGQVSEVPASGA